MIRGVERWEGGDRMVVAGLPDCSTLAMNTPLMSKTSSPGWLIVAFQRTPFEGDQKTIDQTDSRRRY